MAGGFTSVDLSQLPAPSVVEVVDFETIFSEMLSDLRRLDPAFDALVESDPVYKVLQVCAYRETRLRERVNTSAAAVMLPYARGANLDNLGALLDVRRLLLDPGDPDRGIAPTWEDDADFRRRIQLAPEGFSVAGPEGAYVFHALSADADVLDASATSPTPGDVVVSVLSRSGDGTPNAGLLTKVAATLSADTVRPMTDHVTVQAATIRSYSVEATVYTYAGPDSAVVLAEAEARLARYIEQTHRLGRDIARSGVYAALHVSGVQRVDLVQPAADLIIARTEAAFCTQTMVGYGGVAE